MLRIYAEALDRLRVRLNMYLVNHENTFRKVTKTHEKSLQKRTGLTVEESPSL